MEVCLVLLLLFICSYHSLFPYDTQSFIFSTLHVLVLVFSFVFLSIWIFLVIFRSIFITVFSAIVKFLIFPRVSLLGKSLFVDLFFLFYWKKDHRLFLCFRKHQHVQNWINPINYLGYLLFGVYKHPEFFEFFIMLYTLYPDLQVSSHS